MVDVVPVLTIDGPSGTGKGTIAGRLANVLGWHILDSGAFYRAFGYLASRRGISPENDHALRAMGSTALIEFHKIGDEVRIFVEGSDVSETVRGEEGERWHRFMRQFRQSGACCSSGNVLSAVRPGLLQTGGIWGPLFFRMLS